MVHKHTKAHRESEGKQARAKISALTKTGIRHTMRDNTNPNTGKGEEQNTNDGSDRKRR